jgi:para-aminobenzoate synthetase component 1
VTPEVQNREREAPHSPGAPPTWLKSATAEELAARLFQRADPDSETYPLWADGGATEPGSPRCAFAPGSHRLAALPDAVWTAQVEGMEHRGLIPWLRDRLPRGGEDKLYAVLLSYDAGRNLERFPSTAREAPALPDVVVARYPAWLEAPTSQGPWTLRGASGKATHALLAWMDESVPMETTTEPPTLLDSPMGPEEHRRAVQDVLEGIAAGDLYQANVARRLEGPMDPRATPSLYKRLRAASPPAFGALWRLSEGLWLASVSPERLLTWDPDTRTARSFPIKGTRPRSADPAADRRLAAELLADPKERAEHVMIVDLVRNDLGKVAKPGEVTVDTLCTVQRLPTMHHLVSDVRAVIREGVDLADLVGAVFPGGSITGAPKIAAMARIEKVEGLRRGFYTGSLGLVDGRTGCATFNILIRTCVVADGRLMYQTGGGIVADSDPGREWEETEVKASALLRSLHTPP